MVSERASLPTPPPSRSAEAIWVRQPSEGVQPTAWEEVPSCYSELQAGNHSTSLELAVQRGAAADSTEVEMAMLLAMMLRMQKKWYQRLWWWATTIPRAPQEELAVAAVVRRPLQPTPRARTFPSQSTTSGCDSNSLNCRRRRPH